MEQMRERLNELVTLIREGLVPPEMRWLDAEGVAAMLGYDPRYVSEHLANKPGFPRAMRANRTGRPRWLMSEIQEWALSQREPPR